MVGWATLTPLFTTHFTNHLGTLYIHGDSSVISMQLTLELLPYLESLLRLHEKAGQQPDNLCGPYWVSLLLQAYGEFSVSAVEVAIAASTVLPSQGNPADWLPPGASSRLGIGYEQIKTVPNIEECGTSAIGLIRATEQISQGRFCLVPLQTEDWVEGLPNVWHLCQTHPDWNAVPLLNAHTSYFQSSKLTPLELFNYLQQRGRSPSPPDWSVGHFALLIGQLRAQVHTLYALLDTYPHFGWNGLHMQPDDAIAQSLSRPQQSTQGGVALFVKTDWRSHIQEHAIQKGFQITPWNNGSPASIYSSPK